MAELAVGILSNEEKSRVLSALNEIWRGSKACPVSGDNDWVLGDHIVHPPTWHGAAMQLGGATYPHVLLTCRRCGYSLFFNALVLGVVPSETSGENAKAAKHGTGSAA